LTATGRDKAREREKEMAANEVFNIDIHIRFRDLDAMGHVNNAVVFTYFEMGRTEFFLRHLGSGEPSGFNFILAHIRCDYLLPLTLGDRPSLALWIEKIGTKSFNIAYELRERLPGVRVFARGASTQVCYDYQAQRSMSVSPELRKQLTRYLR
jgi:acyl-CoA thioester hydrolase